MDIERAGPQGYSVRRQIVLLSDTDTWIVLDHSQDSVAQTTTTNWTFYPDLVITPEQGQGRFRIAARNSPVVLRARFRAPIVSERNWLSAARRLLRAGLC